MLVVIGSRNLGGCSSSFQNEDIGSQSSTTSCRQDGTGLVICAV